MTDKIDNYPVEKKYEFQLEEELKKRKNYLYVEDKFSLDELFMIAKIKNIENKVA